MGVPGAGDARVRTAISPAGPRCQANASRNSAALSYAATRMGVPVPTARSDGLTGSIRRTVAADTLETEDTTYPLFPGCLTTMTEEGL
jgi:hypothetical protein